ncbi:MAG: ABC transporter substrate-binding protein [Proteobacteria bacterium]|nr:ABC transporter substrate-binding protein [Pseudomonadota bacterium]
MRRRWFLAIAGGAALASPIAVHAQQQVRRWRIGVLIVQPRLEAVRRGLRELGYVEGQNITIEHRPAENAERLPAFAAELARLDVDVIMAGGSQAILAAQQATRRIPIVMTASSDPVGTGLVASLARPGGNTTGMSLSSTEASGKRLELLKEIVTGLSRVVVLWNPSDPPAVIALKETEGAARTLSIETQAVAVQRAEDFDSALDSAAQLRAGAIVILSAPLMNVSASRIAEWALRKRTPSIYVSRDLPNAGGLMSYGPDLDDSTRRSAVFVDKILKGAQPADLPVQQPTKFELVINLKTAKALGITVPQSILLRADEVIE